MSLQGLAVNGKLTSVKGPKSFPAASKLYFGIRSEDDNQLLYRGIVIGGCSL